MNKHVTAFLIKFVATFGVLYLVLGFSYGLTFTQVLLLTAILGVVAYVVGDLFILSKSNNTVATIADFAMGWAIIYLFLETATALDNTFTASLLATVVLSLFEIFFHMYLARNVLPNRPNQAGDRNLRYQTEASEEFEVRNFQTDRDREREKNRK